MHAFHDLSYPASPTYVFIHMHAFHNLPRLKTESFLLNGDRRGWKPIRQAMEIIKS